jgi:hypothetical protein
MKMKEKYKINHKKDNNKKSNNKKEQNQIIELIKCNNKQ